MQNKSFTASLLVVLMAVMVGVAIGSISTFHANAAATTAETGSWESSQGFQTMPITIRWPLSTDVSELVSLPPNYGPPIGYRQIQFQDQDLPAGGYADDATQGSGAVAEELENTFVILEEYGGTGIESYQITVYRQEFDGTIPTCDSVVGWGEFIFAPIDKYFALTY